MRNVCYVTTVLIKMDGASMKRTDGGSEGNAPIPDTPSGRRRSPRHDRTAEHLFRAGWFVALLCSAALSGLALAHVLQSPGSRGLSGPNWLAVQHTFYGGFAIVGGIAEILGLVVAALLAIGLFRRSRGPRVAAIAPAIAALCYLGALLSYWFGNRPVNNMVAEWTSSTLPTGWLAYRNTWEDAHAITAILAAVAFLSLAAALVWRVGRREVTP